MAGLPLSRPPVAIRGAVKESNERFYGDIKVAVKTARLRRISPTNDETYRRFCGPFTRAAAASARSSIGHDRKPT